MLKPLFYLLIITCSLFSTKGFSQGTFQKVFSGPSIEHGRSVQFCPDGGYSLSGNSSSFPVGGYAGYLIKTDSLGTVLWGKTVTGTTFAILEETKVLPDSGFISVGEIADTNMSNHLFIVRWNANGGMLWTKTFSTTDDLFGYDIALSPTGGFFVAALCNAVTKQMYIVHLNEFGDTLWTRHSSDTINFTPYDIVATDDGGVVIASESGPLSGVYKMNLVKLDSTGNLVWSKNYGSQIYNSVTYALESTADNGFILCGSMGGNGMPILIRTDANGDTVWTRMYKATYGNLYLHGISTCDDNGIVACGQMVAGFDVQAIILKTDSMGDTLWTTAFTGLQSQLYRYTGETPGGEYFFTGSSYVSTGNHDILFTKTNNQGRTGCDDTVSIEYALPLGLQVIPAAPAFLPGGLTATQIGISVDSGYISSDLCAMIGIREERISEDFLVYPNPSQGIFRLTFSNKNSSGRLIVCNPLGEFILMKDLQNVESAVIDLAGQPPGIYLLRFESGSQYQTARICLVD